ncbi:ABC transporter ATP-binding protein [Paractinoplanes rishiriensis]|uniref:ABC transporter ATP-binding protein n=1 Tax=Paractinoplanes rishiriensis TaxID=1050105 RepID=A0A919MZ95_9ACTN|nr:dipeptide ABC transporter ATP-binding protein [Actinoplanes rishiriensis]GIF01229.1 ABC transporter ATP-binding protein [Actinoplanes rishiriensis]
MTVGESPILSARGLVKHYPLMRGVVFRTRYGEVRAVDGVDLDLGRGRTLGVVGESGCGKSTMARLLTRLETPTAGDITFDGERLAGLSRAGVRQFRRRVQLIFQDPYSSLDPRRTVGDLVAEPFRIHRDVLPRRDVRPQVQELLEVVGLDPDHLNRYPHQFSGGQRQRISIARALALRPQVIVCDEPVSALDVSVQAQVINLLAKLQKDFGLSYVFIAHDLSVVRHICDRVAVMYLGRVVETGSEQEVYDHPTHPYTQALLSAAPDPDPDRRRPQRIVLTGDVPSPANPPSGCRFRTRCWKSQQRCTDEDPALKRRARPHADACHFSAEQMVADAG